MPSRKVTAAARALGRLGASKGGKASAAALTADERVARAKSAVAARWGRKRSMPADQKAVMNRLKGDEPVTLRIAPGAGGRRRLQAVNALCNKGLIALQKIDTILGFVRVIRVPK